MAGLWRLLAHGWGPRRLLVHDGFGEYAFMVFAVNHMLMERLLVMETPIAVTAVRVWQGGVLQMILEALRSLK